MLSVSLTYNPKQMDRTLEEFLKDVADDVYAEAKKNTPIKTGRARRGWTEQVTSKRAIINNQVPYIGKLEAGASRQAPKGIIGPTLTSVKGKYK